MNWRTTANQKPEDEQVCLTECKYGLISGSYNAKDGTFEGYYWQDITWYAGRWMPIEEVRP